jgi:hypothetical protein
MKKAVLLFVLAAACVSFAATPEEVFANPPAKAHIGVWWHWMGGQVTKEGIEKDLDWFVRSGISSATVFAMADSCTPWAKRIADIPTNGLHPFSDEWWKLFAHACREGKKRGIDIGFHNCPGYTSTGGPWIPSRLAMRELAFNVTNNDERISLVPSARFPVFNEENGKYEKPECPARRTDVRHIATVKGISVSHIPMGSFVQPADWDSFGLECDKMNPEAVAFHLDYIIDEMKKHLGPNLPEAGLCHILLDSYEAGTPSWTPGMREEFTARRGYDPVPFLPILGGFTNLYTKAEVAKFKKDFDRTCRDLYRDVLFKIMHEKLAAEGVYFSCEPYGGPFNSDEVSSHIDQMMTEFWYRPTIPRKLSTGPHAYSRMVSPSGKKHNIIEAEAFTGQPADCMWTEMPSTIKISGDDQFLRGINRFVLHTCPLQPWGDDVKPGVTMGRWGTHFGRTQTWAETGKGWFEYLARCQALLQWGSPSTEKLPGKFHSIARSDGARTVFFVVNRTSEDVPFAMPGKWFDPVTGKIASAPRKLAPNQSGFFEKDEKAGVASEMKETLVALTSFVPALGDWTKSADPETKYFSGTKTYKSSPFGIPASSKAVKLSFPEHLNQVYSIRINGKCAGSVWGAPWTLELPREALKEKGNVLQIDVTNSWANRLVGDEQEAPDCEYIKAPLKIGTILARYPSWFPKGIGERPSGKRKCFVTWNYFTRESPLVPSGLVAVNLICCE